MSPRLQVVNQPMEDYRGRGAEQLLSRLRSVFFHLSKLKLGFCVKCIQGLLQDHVLVKGNYMQVFFGNIIFICVGLSDQAPASFCHKQIIFPFLLHETASF